MLFCSTPSWDPNTLVIMAPPASPYLMLLLLLTATLPAAATTSAAVAVAVVASSVLALYDDPDLNFWAPFWAGSRVELKRAYPEL